jgi:hypothetical protein
VWEGGGEEEKDGSGDGGARWQKRNSKDASCYLIERWLAGLAAFVRPPSEATPLLR